MMAADYRHIDGLENRLGRHYSRFPPFSPSPALADQSLALRKLCDAGSNRRSRANASRKRCAIYTRKSSEEGLEQEFNSLAAQREACEAFIRSQQHEGWVLAKTRYDDGGFSGGNLERPALRQLLTDIQARRIDIVVVYKVDRLTRSLADFARLVELFDAEAVSFVSVTQQFNTTSSMGRLTLNMPHAIDFIEVIFHPAMCSRPTASLDGSWVE